MPSTKYYLTLCQAPEFAVRATLFDGLCLKQQGLFTEAATSYIRSPPHTRVTSVEPHPIYNSRMTNELSDLRSAMLLEQAAYCFLLASPASVRKYGFHIVLAGYRYCTVLYCTVLYCIVPGKTMFGTNPLHVRRPFLGLWRTYDWL